jgi:hypothetical protein
MMRGCDGMHDLVEIVGFVNQMVFEARLISFLSELTMHPTGLVSKKR